MHRVLGRGADLAARNPGTVARGGSGAGAGLCPSFHQRLRCYRLPVGSRPVTLVDDFSAKIISVFCFGGCFLLLLIIAVTNMFMKDLIAINIHQQVSYKQTNPRNCSEWLTGWLVEIAPSLCHAMVEVSRHMVPTIKAWCDIDI